MSPRRPDDTYGCPPSAADSDRDRYRRALELIVSDSQRPELANAEHLRGIAMGALRGSDSKLTRDSALTYLAWLDEGGKGPHWQAGLR